MVWGRFTASVVSHRNPPAGTLIEMTDAPEKLSVPDGRVPVPAAIGVAPVKVAKVQSANVRASPGLISFMTSAILFASAAGASVAASAASNATIASRIANVASICLPS